MAPPTEPAEEEPTQGQAEEPESAGHGHGGEVDGTGDDHAAAELVISDPGVLSQSREAAAEAIIGGDGAGVADVDRSC